MRVWTFLTTTYLLAALAAGALGQTKEVVEDGVRHVRSEEQPPEVVDLEMKPVWNRGDDDDDIFFGMPVRIVHDAAGNCYVLDSQVCEILVFDRNGEHLKTLGREGEGPGEFRNPNDMYLGPGDILGVVSVFPGKIVQLTLDGDPAGTFPLPKSEGEGFQLVFRGGATSDRILICGAKQRSGPDRRRNIQSTYLKAFDKDGKELAHYHTEDSETQYGGMAFEERTFSNFAGYWTVSRDGDVAAALSFDDYRIHVWNPDGSIKYIIERPEYGVLQRSDEDKERMQKLYDGITSWNPNSTFDISETHRAILQLSFRPDGGLWVQSGRGSYPDTEGVLAEFDVYDGRGAFARRVRMIGDGDPIEDGVQFAGDRVYQITDLFGAIMSNFARGASEGGAAEESDPLQIRAFDVDLPELGSN